MNSLILLGHEGVLVFEWFCGDEGNVERDEEKRTLMSMIVFVRSLGRITVGKMK